MLSCGVGKDKSVMPDFGSGFSKRVLYQAVQFYKTYPKVNALRSQLGWFQYRLLTQISDPVLKRVIPSEAKESSVILLTNKAKIQALDCFTPFAMTTQSVRFVHS